MRPDVLHIKNLQRAIAQSDQHAFSSLFRMLYPGLFNFAMQYVHVKEIAEEITNDVFVKLWKRKDQLPAIDNLSTYLFVAVKNHALNYLKQYSNLHVAVENAEGDSSLVNRDDPEQQLEWKEISFRLNQAIDKLPDQCKTVFRLVKEDGFKYKEVAEILGISPRTVETQLVRAIKKLHSLIGNTNNIQSRKRKLPPLPIILTPLFFIFY